MKYIQFVKLSDISRLSVFVTNCRKSLSEVKTSTGADYILNGGMWNTSDGSPCAGLKVEGKLLSKTPWGNVHGYGWTGIDIHMTLDWKSNANYLAVSPIIKDGVKYPEKTYDNAQDGVRGRSAIGMTKDALVLYCSGDKTADESSPEKLTRELLALGCDSAMMLDGGGSSQCDFAGKQIKASRKVHNWICVWTKKTAETPPEKEDKPVSKPIICIDPGHWPGSVNCAPDKSYWEYEFTWDLYTRLRPLLEKQGFTVVGTRTEHENPSLTARATVSNKGQRRRRYPVRHREAVLQRVHRPDRNHRPRCPAGVRLSHQPGGSGLAENVGLPGQAGESYHLRRDELLRDRRAAAGERAAGSGGPVGARGVGQGCCRRYF